MTLENIDDTSKHSEAKKIKLEMEMRSKEYDDRRKQLELCKKCWMVAYTGDGWYCPLPYCGRDFNA